jgi:hypothetical protein
MRVSVESDQPGETEDPAQGNSTLGINNARWAASEAEGPAILDWRPPDEHREEVQAAER